MALEREQRFEQLRQAGFTRLEQWDPELFSRTDQGHLLAVVTNNQWTTTLE